MKWEMCPKPQKQAWSICKGQAGSLRSVPMMVIHAHQEMVTTTDVSCGLLCLSPFLNPTFINPLFV